jgi:DNA-binding transcriptional MerR regulator
MEADMYKIGDFSRLSQIPVKTLRYYDEMGLLRPARVEPSTGYRYYTAAQLAQLNRVLVFRDLGFSLREIRAVVAENVPPDQIRGMLRLKHHQLARRVERENARLLRAAARLLVLEHCGAEAASSHEVAVRDVGTRLVASVRDTLGAHHECAGLFEELEHYTGGHGRRRQRGAIWHACADGRVDCEALVFLPARVEARGRLRVYDMPAHRVASLVYRGEQDFLPAFRAIRTWLVASGVEVIGPKREIFLADHPDAESVTEIQFPIGLESENVH